MFFPIAANWSSSLVAVLTDVFVISAIVSLLAHAISLSSFFLSFAALFSLLVSSIVFVFITFLKS